MFEAIFYGDLAESRDSVELPDCEYESLLELFRYMYSDEKNLSGSDVMGVVMGSRQEANFPDFCFLKLIMINNSDKTQMTS